ncbi:type II toxin-antitoxin system PemK/MazF family toxin [Pseudonocardia endophytica]|uniref:PemK-like, MazF-like toxin of type II toxin-antitoxin system n=1 Tax=Pseudonocardia endophytica TaxID=401976 RepID=A0A4R1I4P8_PSEEN|nr:type II toxin-antitoxin system PemK/MazF family toxin [Pseudonocardia endophytica]TCK25002.1 PemK-like, MazF-like toxin of type II toxin-antitoxin system [Pseudonocardia endophytica]
MADWGSFLRQGVDVVLSMLTETDDKQATPPPAGHTGVRTAPAGERARQIVYAPEPDGAADPGEIVWTWVPFEEDPSQGKDRPLLVVGRSGSEMLGLMLSSQQHRADDANWISIGSGEWDREGRGSFIRLDRVLEVEEHGIRREGAVLDRDRFDRVAAELRQAYGWS